MSEKIHGGAYGRRFFDLFYVTIYMKKCYISIMESSLYFFTRYMEGLLWIHTAYNKTMNA
ncbi:hypothetical protein J2T12_000835 [Paenibacillus anaericanus]|nr:hypothetical protein [Paenibacillus anaericanus]